MSHNSKMALTERRVFLKQGTAAMMLPLLSGSDLLASGGPDHAVSTLVPVGYWPGTGEDEMDEILGALDLDGFARRSLRVGERESRETVSEQAEDARPRFVAADSLRYGDPRFARDGAHVTIHGLVEGRQTGQLPGFSLGVPYRVHNGRSAEVVTVPAFELSGQRARSLSAPVDFFVPIEAHGSLTLSLTVEPSSREGLISPLGVRENTPEARPAAVETQMIHLMIDGTPGAAKLRQGVYLIGLDGRPALGSRAPLPEDGGLLMSVEYGTD